MNNSSKRKGSDTRRSSRSCSKEKTKQAVLFVLGMGFIEKTLDENFKEKNLFIYGSIYVK